MAFEVNGKVHEVYPTQQVTEKFKKREFVLEIDDRGYTQYIKFQANQDRTALLDNVKKGDQVKVSFDLSGRPFQNREGQTVYFTNLVAWKVEALASAPKEESFNDYSLPDSYPAHDDSDIPF